MSDYEKDIVLKSALKLASLGMRIFPVHGIVNEKCTCNGRENCTPGKHPRITKFYQRATTEEDKIRKWFLTEFPQSNIGVVTGGKSGLWILDVDSKTGGYESLEDLKNKHGTLPQTYRVQTGGGGEHYYFKYPSELRIRCSAGELAAGLDVRGDGGYVLGPGSSHISGNSYSWLSGPEDVEKIAPAPEWLLTIIKEASTKKSREKLFHEADFDATFEQIVEGTRNTTLFEKFACHLRDKAISEAKVKIICLAINAYSCSPPLEKSEVIGAVNSAYNFPVRPSRIRSISEGSERVLELLRLWAEYEETGWVECSIKELASTVGLSPKGTGKCLRQLDEFGLLKTQEFSGKPSRYNPLPSDSSQLCES
jgi:putative DNA primase/helicase